MAEPHANLDARRRLRRLQWVDVEPWKRGSGRRLLEDHGQTTRRGHFNNQFFDRLIGKSRLCYVPDMFDKTVDRYSHGVRGVIEKTTDFNHNVGIYVAWQISHTSSPTYRNIAAFLSIVESSRRNVGLLDGLSSSQADRAFSTDRSRSPALRLDFGW
ncbi:hypothetical protein [Mesorhizobium loti]|uniref:hypothetical protein n=1 Tax=Rhizobium loti TaxID=381 RepID=UPI001474F108|nr:hypothetical protein [Mesorhizobium loti]